MRRRALLACESGAGRGHILSLRAVAESLQGRFAFDAALYQTQFASAIADVCESVFRGAGLHYDLSGRSGAGDVRTATWGEFMGDFGFRDPAFLKRQIEWWCEVIRARRISLVIADYAPCALLAARCMGIACAVTGTGYGIAPSHLREFPVLLPDINQRIYDESEMVTAVNEAAVPLGLAPIEFLPEVYRCDVQFPRTLALLDPYDGMRDDLLIPPLADVATRTAENGGEIFIYFSTTERDNPILVEAITDLGAPVRLFMPGISGLMANYLSSTGVMVETAPVPVDLLAERSRMIMHAGQHGIICLALAAGLPQVAIPQHLEQLLNARRMADAGVLKILDRKTSDLEAIRAVVRGVYNDSRMQARAGELAKEQLPSFQLDARAMIRDRLAHL